jgi:hypothetical protein
MKKFCVLLKLVILGFSNCLLAQHSFERIISEPEDQIINDVIEDNDGNYIMAGRIKDAESSFYSGYIIKFDSTGNSLQEEIISSNESISSLFFNIHLFNNHFYILGSQIVTYPDTSKLWYLKLNLNLEIEGSKLLNIPNGRSFSYMNSIIDSDTNFVVTGYTTRMDETNNYNNDAFFYKLNINGDSLKSKFYTSPVPLHFSFDIIEKFDNSSYFAFVSHFTNIFGTSGQRMILDKNLDSLAIDSIPKQVYDYYSPVYLNQNDILICGKRGAEPPIDYALNVLSITSNCQLNDYNTFKKGAYRDHPAMFNSVSKNGNNIYIGGTSNLDYSNPFWSTFNSWFHLVKINPDITTIWEYWYGGDAYYFLYSILATNDGGCLMVGSRYDNNTQDQERDIYVVKVDSNGLITWTKEIPTDKQETSIYPNPGTSQLNIKTKGNLKDFELLNINGQVVIREMLDKNNSIINVESIKPGIYFYRLVDKKNKTVETGKWIKH